MKVKICNFISLGPKEAKASFEVDHVGSQNLLMESLELYLEWNLNT